MHERTRLGRITAGSFIEGLTARLDARASIEELRVGKFVVVQGERHEYFSMITDVALAATSAQIVSDPPDANPFLYAVLAGTATYGTFQLAPRLMLPRDQREAMQPVKTIPPHFAPVYDAEAADFARVFGTADGTSFEIGRPLDMDVPVCLDLKRLVERSNGIFGKSGTGKSFLTRLLLSGTMAADVCSSLIFDMHSEYGWDSRAEGGHFVKGLAQLFGDKVLVYTLDATPRHRVDGSIVIGLNQIEVEDVLSLQDELNLNTTAAESAYLLQDRFHTSWLQKLLEMDSSTLHAFAEESGANVNSLSALKRKLSTVARLDYVRDKVDFSAVDHMIEALARGRHVVLEFGKHDNLLDYMLVANIITRRIHARWVQQTETYRSSKQAADQPRPLMITIEEAHRFLTPAIARQTIFGKIAREMRKYSVTLLVVDQRPSSIDAEVMSQLGTRITAQLNDDRDIDAVFAGVSGSGGLKAVLASLDSKQQALILGHAVPMPVVVRTRAYDETFYRVISNNGTAVRVSHEQAQTEMDELFP